MSQPGAHVTVLYFAWLRERAGMAEERVTIPPAIQDVQSLIAWLSAQSPGRAAAFANPATIRAAVNQDFASLDAPVRDGDEIAFFPPVTGG